MAKVMIVDDEDDTLEMVALFLQKEGFEIATAGNGTEFLDKVDDFQPDLVTLDIMMPGLNARQILRELREKMMHPKIILLTVVRLSAEELTLLHRFGNIVDYLTKPFDLDDLIR
ncbi:MAG: response regulator, partial [Candidatus Thermoplasmatota archaeon]|nr:response regulator [Candidatus Thermoplasmatota archaeon]